MINQLIRLGLFCSIVLTTIEFLHANNRSSILLDKGWGYKPISSTAKATVLTPVTLPHTWNANYLQGTTSYNREMMIYMRNLDVTADMQGKRLFLYFEGVNSSADVFVNFKSVGNHLGGYSAFCMEITDYVKQGNNDLQVWVSNAYRTDILPISGDFNIYGGIHRPCHLIITDNNCISPLFYASPGVFIHQKNITEKEADITVETKLSLKVPNGNLKLKTTFYDQQGKQVAVSEVPVAGEVISQAVKIQHPILWDGKKNPYQYTVKAELLEQGKPIDEVVQKTGFRYFTVDAEKGFFLNGKYLNLYGFCRHEDVEGKGSALVLSDYQKDMDLIKESGATAMRLAHYPHAETMYDMCDENGIILWTEIPFCGPGGYAYTGYLKNVENNARQVLKELVYQKYNHPSIMFWGVFNEILVDDGVKFKAYDDPIPFVKELNALYKQLDSTRLTAFATCVDQTKYQDCADLIAWNKYFGWYSDAAPGAGKFFDKAKEAGKGKPVGVSEYGGGASIHHHQWPLVPNSKSGSNIVDGNFPASFHPEEAQSNCHEGNWSAFVNRPYLWGKFSWVFTDYQSSIRKEGDKEGINDKGLITYDRSVKKDAFYFYKANWNPEPMIYITSRRFINRTNAEAQVKVYTNLNEISLYVNEKLISKQKKDELNRVIWESIKLQKGQNKIQVKTKVKGKEISDTCFWNLN